MATKTSMLSAASVCLLKALVALSSVFSFKIPYIPYSFAHYYYDCVLFPNTISRYSYICKA